MTNNEMKFVSPISAPRYSCWTTYGPRQANLDLSPMRAAKVQASLRIRAVSPEPSLLAHTSNESRGTFRQKARSLAPLNGWACAVKICHDGMLEDTNSLDGALMALLAQCLHVSLIPKWMDGWVRVLRPFNSISVISRRTWKALCNEAPFRFEKNLASSGIRTRDPVNRSRER